MKKKLELKSLKVTSFCTLDTDSTDAVKGGWKYDRPKVETFTGLFACCLAPRTDDPLVCY